MEVANMPDKPITDEDVTTEQILRVLRFVETGATWVARVPDPLERAFLAAGERRLICVFTEAMRAAERAVCQNLRPGEQPPPPRCESAKRAWNYSRTTIVDRAGSEKRVDGAEKFELTTDGRTFLNELRPAAGTTPATRDVSDAFMSAPQLAVKWGAPKEAVDARLRRARKARTIKLTEWNEKSTRLRNEPKHFYRERAVLPIIRDLIPEDRRPTA